MRLCQRGDAAHFGNTTDNADVGLNDIGAPDLQKTQEVIAIVKTFTRCQRAVQPLFQVSPHLDIFRTQRLFKK
ncbi:hypothetical protein D3C87_2042690 [compost metagenome]